MRERLEEREVRERRQRTPQQDDRLSPDPVRERAEDHEEGSPEQQRDGDEDIGRLRIDLERLCEEEQRVELPRVPDDRLARGEAEEREQHDLEIGPLGERFRERRLGLRSLGLHRLEDG